MCLFKLEMRTDANHIKSQITNDPLPRPLILTMRNKMGNVISSGHQYLQQPRVFLRDCSRFKQYKFRILVDLLQCKKLFCLEQFSVISLTKALVILTFTVKFPLFHCVSAGIPCYPRWDQMVRRFPACSG